MSTLPPTALKLASNVELLVLDVDGVLTDGRLLYGPEGELLKAFHAKDGQGLRLAASVGIELAVISGRSCEALHRRLQDLGIQHAYTGVGDKIAAMNDLQRRLGVALGRMAYVGDDIADLPVMRMVGLPITVADGHASVKAAATWVTQALGGQGAVREVTDGLIAARDSLDEVIERYLQSKMTTTGERETP